MDLLEVEKLNEKINEEMLELARLRAELTDISAHCIGERVQTSRSYDKMDRLVLKVTTLEAKIDKDIDEYVEYVSFCETRLKKLSKERYYDILRMKYIESKTVREIAIELKITPSAVKKAQKLALIEYKGII